MFFSPTLFIAMLTSRNSFLFKKQARIFEGDENMGMWTQVILCLTNCERSGWNECDPCGYIINKKISFLEKEVIPCSNESLPGSVYYFLKTTGWNGTVLEWLDRVPRGLNGFVFTQIHRSAKRARKRVKRCVWREIPLTRRIWSSLRPLGVTDRITFPRIYRLVTENTERWWAEKM